MFSLTFENVGRTPENKCHVYVDDESRLVTQWDYYPKAFDPEPRFQFPWLEWALHGAILLSASRGERQHEGVHDVSDADDKRTVSGSASRPERRAITTPTLEGR